MNAESKLVGAVDEGGVEQDATAVMHVKEGIKV